MNFQNLKNVEKAETYLDIAFGAARKKERPRIVHRADRLKLVKTYEYQNIQTITNSITKNLRKITTSFPVIDKLPEFYRELIHATLDYPRLKKSLGAVLWAEKRTQSLFQNYSVKIKKGIKVKSIIEHRREFYGRVSSILKQINGELDYIEKSRIIMKRFPNIKTGLFTLAIAGYPNVGKSSLLKTLTSARPEIKDYAFTTKAINIGYLKKLDHKIQVVDTPGGFDRGFNDMNPIERQSYLILKYVADMILFIIDPTENCGYDIRKQKNLLSRIRKFEKNILVIYNKADLIKQREQDKLYISTITGEGIDKLLDLAKENKTD